MLALTPMPLQTAGERALFAELARWDTGGAVRGAVVASIPVVTDGALQRRISDAVLLVPEGLAVVRIVEAARQSGVVTARPEGPWTIGPGSGPGDVLQLSGGGSTPLDGLMRAGMDAAMRLRAAGLEPGRIARLTVLVGDGLTGLEPADGDLGEGDQVALCEPRSLLLGIARASRYSGVDNPRLWTTADVRAALEALGLQGRGPSVEELNGEGFAYSPYVLRRPELLTPAAMTKSPPSAAPSAGPPSSPAVPVTPSPSATPPSAPPSSPAVPDTAAAVAASIASAHAAAAAAQGMAQGSAQQLSPVPAPITGTTPLLAAAAAPAAPAQAPAQAPVQAPSNEPTGGRVRDTVSLGVQNPPGSVDDGEAGAPEDTDGIGGLFASARRYESEPAESAPYGSPTYESRAYESQAYESQPRQAPRTAVLPGQAPPAADEPQEERGDRAASRRRLAMGLLAAAGVVLLLVVAGVVVLLTRGGGSGTVDAGATSSSAADSGPQLQPGHTQEIDGITFTLQAVRVDDSCADHSYGKVAGFFAGTDCTHLARALYSAEVDGHPFVAAVSRVQMPSGTVAGNLRQMTDTSGTGNVSDLLREGVHYPGGPQRLSRSEYASSIDGPVVTIVETSWADPASAGSSGQLDLMASDGLGLDMPGD